ncbi:MAG: ThiF family adenylyltransferase [Gemmataceae bacterium]|nr:ThiF family adenylyltransferase [Gemmataceae bacterium]
MSEVAFVEIACRDAQQPAASAEGLPRTSLADRLPRFVGLSADPLPVLSGLRVGVVGVGSVGRNVALHLARLHIEALWLIDPGRYKPASLLTQPIGPADVGQPKATSTGSLCKAISPRTRVFACDGAVERLPLTALADAHAVVLATDNLAAEVETGQRCLRLGGPLVQASVHGDTLVSQVRFFANRGGEGACPACGFTAAEWAALNREGRFSCAGWAGGEIQRETVAAPTMSVSFLCSLAADLACMQLLRHVLKLGPPVEDSLLEHCGYTHRTVVSPLSRNLDCPCEHQAWQVRPAPGPLASCSLGELARTVGENGDLERASFAVEGAAFAEVAVCRFCGQAQRCGRFVRRGESAGPCRSCGSATQPEPFYCHDPVPAEAVLTLLGHPLGEIGGAAAAWVLVRDGERAVWFREGHTLDYRSFNRGSENRAPVEVERGSPNRG